jgi:hypothetical protein
MHELLDGVLEASSQTEAQARLEQGSDELEQKTASAFKALEEGLLDAIAANALSEKYHERLQRRT